LKIKKKKRKIINFFIFFFVRRFSIYNFIYRKIMKSILFITLSLLLLGSSFGIQLSHAKAMKESQESLNNLLIQGSNKKLNHCI
jgi:heme/copper-type cytochrome/quinol oxidase subunit 3